MFYLRIFKVVNLIIICLMLGGCAGVQFPNFQEMMINLSQNYPAIWKMVTGLAYVGGFVFMMRAVYNLKQYGLGVSMVSQNNLKGPLVLFFIGAVLMFLPTIKSSILASTFGYGQQQSVLQYVGTFKNWDQQSMSALFGLIQIFGIISFVRGWFQLSHMASQSQQNTLAKAITHIIGGILAINIVGTIKMLQATFGITSS